MLFSFEGEGALHMALDAALLELAESRPVPPVLRFYTWSPPAVSLGRFQNAERAIDLARAARAGVSVVRRPTGGRAVLHDGDLTYTLVARRDDPVFGGARSTSLRTVADALAAGLARVGIMTSGEAAGPPEARRGAARTAVPPCFVSAAREELCVDGRKLLGSARVEGRAAFLQHGSLPLTRGPVEISRFLPGDERSREMARARLSAQATSLAAAAPDVFPQLDVPRLCEALRLGFETRAARAFHPSEPTRAELARAAELAPLFAINPVVDPLEATIP